MQLWPSRASAIQAFPSHSGQPKEVRTAAVAHWNALPSDTWIPRWKRPHQRLLPAQRLLPSWRHIHSSGRLKLRQIREVSRELLTIGKQSGAIGSLRVEKVQNRSAALVERRTLDIQGLLAAPRVRIFV